MIDELFKDSASPGAQRAMMAMMDMKKLDIAKLEAAVSGVAIASD